MKHQQQRRIDEIISGALDCLDKVRGWYQSSQTESQLSKPKLSGTSYVAPGCLVAVRTPDSRFCRHTHPPTQDDTLKCSWSDVLTFAATIAYAKSTLDVTPHPAVTIVDDHHPLLATNRRVASPLAHHRTSLVQPHYRFLTLRRRRRSLGIQTPAH